MAEKLGEALLDLDTNDKAFRKGVDRAERDATGLGRTFDGISQKAKLIGISLGLAAAAGTVALGVLIKRSIDAADEMSKAAQRAGATTEELSRLAWAGELSDVSLGTLTTSMGRLSNVMAQMASGGAKETKALFDQLGISVTDADGKLRSTAEVIPELADRFAAMENGAEKTALAIQIFGRSGSELIPLLNNASDGLRKAADESDRLGKTFSTLTGQQAELFNDNLTRLSALLEGAANKITAGMLPGLVSLTNLLTSSAMDFGGLELAVNSVLWVFKEFMIFLAQTKGMLDSLAATMWSVNRAMEFMAQGDAKGAMATLQQTGIETDQIWKNVSDTIDQINNGTLGGGMEGPIQPRGTGAPGLFNGAAGQSAAEKNALDQLIASLKAERDVLRETDPVQQRLIGLRDQLKNATGAQRAEVESLIGTIHQEAQAWEAAQSAGQFFGDQMVSSLEGLRKGTKSLTDVVNDMIDALAQAVLQSMLLGQGPLSGMFGTQSAGGGIGGALGSLFSGFFAKGGLIPNGTFGIVGEKGPEPVVGTSSGARVLPNSTLSDMMAPAAASGPMQVIVQGAGLTQSEMTQAIADAFERFSRHTLPQRVNEITGDPLARG